MDKHGLRDLYTKETGNSFPDDIAKYADWMEEKLTERRLAVWISIDDRVPGDDVKIPDAGCSLHLMDCDLSDPEVKLFIEDGYPNIFSGYFHGAAADHRVTHWMPLLPPPPESTKTTNNSKSIPCCPNCKTNYDVDVFNVCENCGHKWK